MNFTSNQVEVESITDIHPLLAINKEAKSLYNRHCTMNENYTCRPENMRSLLHKTVKSALVWK